MAGSETTGVRARPGASTVAAGLALTVVAIACCLWTLQVGTTSPSVVALQIAGDADRAHELLAGADQETLDDLRTGLQRDNVLVLAYVAAAAFWLWYGRVNLRTRRTRRLAQVLTGAVVVAGVADLVENRALSDLLDEGGDNDAAAVVATAAAIPKWMILAVVLPGALVIACGAVLRIVRRRSRRRGGLAFWRLPRFPDPDGGPDHPLTPADTKADPDEFDRHMLAVAPKVSGPGGPLGVCFSGGGIRSATFNLGVLQVLSTTPAPPELADPDDGGEAPTLLKSAAWLSCVSGGGYIAGALQMLSRDPSGDEAMPPALTFAAGSSEVRHVRHHGRYIADTAGQWAAAIARVLAGVALNVGVFALILFVIGRPLGWIQHDLFHLGGVRDVDDMQTTGAMWAAVGWTLGGAIALYLLGTLWGGLDGSWRRRFERSGLGFLLLGLGVLASVWLLPLLTRRGPDLVAAIGRMLPWVDDPAGNESGASVLIVTGAGSLAGTALAIINRPPPAPETTAKPRFPAMRSLGKWLVRALPYVAGFILAAIAVLVLAVFTSQAAAAGIRGEGTIFGIDGALELTAFLIAAGVLAVIYLTGDQTRWSLAPFYKRRLASAFALQAEGDTVSERDWSQPTTLSRFARPHPDLPELLVCAAANLSDPEAAPPGRRAQSFVFSAEWVGGPQVGWARTTDFEAALRGATAGDGTLLGAMGISGAAFASAMGHQSKGAINALLAASNARLGVWLPSPNYVQELRGVRPEPPYEDAPDAAPAAPYAGPWAGYRRLPYLFKELFGTYTVDDRFLYLTDGGHYENLGLVELMRRQCRVILCFDASGDDLVSCGTFVEALTLAQEELGIEVAIDLSPLAPRATGERPPGVRTLLDARLSERSVVHGHIHYADGTRGHLVLAKASLTESTPGTVLAHAARQAKATFPNDSTGDQFFDYTQFDAYSTLGHVIATQAVAQIGAACRTCEALEPAFG
jgi:hypothetical protein